MKEDKALTVSCLIKGSGPYVLNILLQQVNTETDSQVTLNTRALVELCPRTHSPVLVLGLS